MVTIVGDDNCIVIKAFAQVAEKQLRVSPVAAVVVPPLFLVGGFVLGNLLANSCVGCSRLQGFYRFQKRGQCNPRISLDGMAGRVVGAEYLRVDVHVAQGFWRVNAIASGGDFREPGSYS